MFDTTDHLKDSKIFDPVSPKATKRKELKAEKEARQFRRDPKPMTPRTPKQGEYIESITNNTLTFGIGPAGVGKTYVAARLFGEWLIAKKISKIYVARPNISKAKHRNGFLPGDISEKCAPWLVPIYDGIRDSMGPAMFDKLQKEGTIEEVPFEFIQGRTLRGETGSNIGVACIVDEAENLDLDDLYITLTRQGEGLTMVLCGDSYQSRIPDSGLDTTIAMARKGTMKSVGVIEFSEEDVVRSTQAMQWVKAFRNHWGADTANPNERRPLNMGLVKGS